MYFGGSPNGMAPASGAGIIVGSNPTSPTKESMATSIIGQACRVLGTCGKPAVGWMEGLNGKNRVPICQEHYDELMKAKAAHEKKEK